MLLSVSMIKVLIKTTKWTSSTSVIRCLEHGNDYESNRAAEHGLFDRNQSRWSSSRLSVSKATDIAIRNKSDERFMSNFAKYRHNLFIFPWRVSQYVLGFCSRKFLAKCFSIYNFLSAEKLRHVNYIFEKPWTRWQLTVFLLLQQHVFQPIRDVHAS